MVVPLADSAACGERWRRTLCNVEPVCSKPFGGVINAASSIEKLLDDTDDSRHRGTTGAGGVAVDAVLDGVALGELVLIPLPASQISVSRARRWLTAAAVVHARFLSARSRRASVSDSSNRFRPAIATSHAEPLAVLMRRACSR